MLINYMTVPSKHRFLQSEQRLQQSHSHPICIINSDIYYGTYNCQLFLRYKREIFILGVLGFLKTTRSFPNIPEEVRSFPKTPEDFRSLPKASSLPVLFTSKIRDREEGIVIYSFHTWFSFLTWV